MPSLCRFLVTGVRRHFLPLATANHRLAQTTRTDGRENSKCEKNQFLLFLSFSSLLSPQPIQLEQQQKEESVSTASDAARAHAARAEGGADNDDGLKSSRPSPPRRRRRAAAAGS
ncbi:hypothetical protein GPALN_005692 [Globodera pallida]|nr:hypothetical protein GPALN_005692 [Globodera pallida]